MNRPRLRSTAATLILLALLSGPALAQKATTKAPALRPEVGVPLQAAQALIQSKKYKDALAKVDAAEQVGKLNPYEQSVILKMRAAAAIGAGQQGVAFSAYEQLLRTPLPPEEKLIALETSAKLAYGAKAYGKAAQYIGDYQSAGGNKADLLDLLPQVYYLSGDFSKAALAVKSQLANLEKAGKKPSQNQLQLLASSASKQNDAAGYIDSLERLVTYYPTPDYWLDLIARVSTQQGFSQNLTLDVYRLRKATGTLKQAGDYMEATQLALQAGYPGEAQQFLDEGYQKKLLGTGAEASRQQRLKDLVVKKMAEDQATLAEGEKAAAAQANGDALLNTGFNYVAYGQYDKGIALMQQGLAKDVKAPDQARLQLGYAQRLAGKHADALKTLRSVKGNTGAQSLARLWSIIERKG
jgi:hypothetical protein